MTTYSTFEEVQQHPLHYVDPRAEPQTMESLDRGWVFRMVCYWKEEQLAVPTYSALGEVQHELQVVLMTAEILICGRIFQMVWWKEVQLVVTTYSALEEEVEASCIDVGQYPGL